MSKDPRIKAVVLAGMAQLVLLLAGLVTALIAGRLPALRGQDLPVLGSLTRGYALWMAAPMAWAALVAALHEKIRRQPLVFGLMLTGSWALVVLFAVLDGYLLAEIFGAWRQ